ncbi:diflavin flavoprotein a 2-related [Anaeramoeba ignava]|uniref:Diflavin flavoprotein a 2-related n=1 Tax=Anaeramoeba ignava TaxID=1746090 RepID=A0A9Q0LSB1_ANAIG|nr:diflavin flavoprotein a 2-related [Anaeramoeba ignava]
MEAEKLQAVEIQKNFYWVGALDPDIRIFDIVMYCEFGTTYNSYLLKGSEKTALIETVKDTNDSYRQFEERLNSILKKGEKLDYVIHNHAEPDHSGASYRLLSEKFPEATIIASRNGVENIKHMYGDDAEKFRFLEARDGLIVRLGGFTLSFMMNPLVHWPDTMFTYCPELKTIFTCDLFGSHYSSPKIFKDLLDEKETADMWKAAKGSYFDPIFGPYKKYVVQGLDKIKELELEMICCAHGPVIRKNIEEYMEKYREWSKITLPKNKVLIVHIAAYGFTNRMATLIKQGLESIGKDIEVKMLNFLETTETEIMKELGESRGLLLGSPTLLSDAVPPIMKIAANLNPVVHGTDPETRLVACSFGSYGWSGEAADNICQRLAQARVRIPLRPLKVQLRPSKKQEEQCVEWGAKFGRLMLGLDPVDEDLEKKIRIKQTSFRKVLNPEMAQNIGRKTFRDAQDGKIYKWRCIVCGEIVYATMPPEVCPACGVSQEVFVMEDEVENFPDDWELSETLQGVTDKIVVIGASAAGVSAVQAIREQNKKAQVTLISGESAPPYYRPSLTKYLLDDRRIEEEAFQLVDPQWFVENSVEFLLGTVVTNINIKKKRIELQSREKGAGKKKQISYDRLILAVGANQTLPKEKTSIFHKRAKTDILGEATSKKINVFAFRTLEDSKRIKSYIRANKVNSAIVLGAGPLGLEVMEGLLGLGVKEIKAIESRKHILSSRLDDQGSLLVQKFLKRHGVKFHLGYEMHHILDNSNNKKYKKTEKTASNLAHGIAIQSIDIEDTSLVEIYADIVIFATGVHSEMSLAKKIGLTTKNGIVVDSRMKTSNPDIFACGDCIEYKGFNERSWRNAQASGRVAGLAALGDSAVTFRVSVSPYAVAFAGLNIFCIGNIHEPTLESVSFVSQKIPAYTRLFFRDEGFRSVICGAMLITTETSMIVSIEQHIRAQTPFKKAIKSLIVHTFAKDKKKQVLSKRAKARISKSNIPNLYTLFHFKEGFTAFHRFLCDEFTEETLDFWVDAENYAQIPDNNKSQAPLAKQIFHDYLRYGAEKEVNIDHFARVECSDRIKNNDIDRTIFLTAQRQIAELLQSDLLKRFLRSPEAKPVIEKFGNLQDKIEKNSEDESTSSD